jgi:hypothetical protein
MCVARREALVESHRELERCIILVHDVHGVGGGIDALTGPDKPDQRLAQPFGELHGDVVRPAWFGPLVLVARESVLADSIGMRAWVGSGLYVVVNVNAGIPEIQRIPRWVMRARLCPLNSKPCSTFHGMRSP